MEIVSSGAGLKQIFYQFDSDKSGILDITEFYAAFEASYNKNKIYRPK